MILSKKVIFNLTLILLNYITCSRSESPKIVIIGAGASGIAAAVKLFENDFTDIKILEAEDRIGGRIHSVKFKDAFVDLGAEFVAGEVNNTVYDMVKDLGVLKSSPNDSLPIYYSNATRLRGDFESDLYSLIFDYYDDEFNVEDETNTSLEEAFLKKYNSTLVPKYASENDQKIIREAVGFSELLVTSQEGSFNWKEIAAMTHFEDSPGDQYLSWNGGRGFKTIFDILMKAFPDKSKKIPVDEKVVFKKTVSKIKWNVQNGTVAVETSDNESFPADHVIFTPSLGVLKASHDSLFDPPLPQEKKDAIENLGFGGLMKVIVHFPEKWWDSDFPGALFLWSEEDSKKTLEEFKDGPIKDGVSWVSKITNIVIDVNLPNLATVWLSGDMVPEFEEIPVDVMKKGIFYVLNKFLGAKFKITPIDDILMSRWCTNKNFRGTDSFEKTGFYKKKMPYQHVLGEPLKTDSSVLFGRPLVLFGGEATSAEHFATVHGAIESGFEQATKLMLYYEDYEIKMRTTV